MYSLVRESFGFVTNIQISECSVVICLHAFNLNPNSFVKTKGFPNKGNGVAIR